MQNKFKIMEWAVAKCPSINLNIMNEMMPSLLDSGIMMSLCDRTILIAILGCGSDQQKDQILKHMICLT